VQMHFYNSVLSPCSGVVKLQMHVKNSGALVSKSKNIGIYPSPLKMRDYDKQFCARQVVLKRRIARYSKVKNDLSRTKMDVRISQLERRWVCTPINPFKPTPNSHKSVHKLVESPVLFPSLFAFPAQTILSTSVYPDDICSSYADKHASPHALTRPV
jgi:hypothetical protein